MLERLNFLPFAQLHPRNVFEFEFSPFAPARRDGLNCLRKQFVQVRD
jgi:hypothetical protein